MNRSTHSTVRKLKTATEGQYLLQPGLASAAPDTILGIPVVISESMPAIGANSLSIALGDFRQAMTVIRRSGYKVLRDPYSTKGRTAFYAYMRVGAGTVDFNAIKLLKFSAS
jgi:HK97 family phage major capsid protein